MYIKFLDRFGDVVSITDEYESLEDAGKKMAEGLKFNLDEETKYYVFGGLVRIKCGNNFIDIVGYETTGEEWAEWNLLK